MVTFNKLLVISGDAYSYYSKLITENDIVITSSRNVHQSLSKASRNVILIERETTNNQSRSDKFNLISKYLNALNKDDLARINIAIFQEDAEPANILVPLMHKMIPASAPFLVEYKRLTLDTYALLKELTLMGIERNVYILNRQITPSSSKLRRILMEAIAEDTGRHGNGIYTVSIKRYKNWSKLKKWKEEAETVAKKIVSIRIPDNYQPYIQSLKSRIREATFYINGTKFTKPLQEYNKVHVRLEPLIKFKLKDTGITYCFKSRHHTSNVEKCSELEYLDDEIIYLAFPRLEPVFPYESEDDEVLHAMRLYDRTVSSKGCRFLHPFNPNEITNTSIKSWKDVILFLTDYKEMNYFLDKIKSKLTPLIVLRDVINKCEDTFQCDENYNANKDELKRILNEPLSKYIKLVDEYINMSQSSKQPDSNEVKKLENNLATLIMSITDDEFLEFITKNYDQILKLLAKLSRVT
jgi:hypothetical protein